MFKLGNIEISIDSAPVLIGELSGNHNGSLDRALDLVEAACRLGLKALKLQTYTADTMTVDCASSQYLVTDPKSLWRNKNLYELYDEAHTPWEWHSEIFAKCKESGIVPFSSPFDPSAVEFLEQFDPCAYKVASFEITDHRLLRCIGETGKPVILSTGLARLWEIDEALEVLTGAGCREYALMKCTSSYPAKLGDLHLSTIDHMRKAFGCEVGYSDHSVGVGAGLASVALGASFVEKHFTDDRNNGGVDAAFSGNYAEFEMLLEEMPKVWLAKGDVHYGATDNEMSSMIFRRSLIAVAKIRAGDAISDSNVKSLRPGYGLSPRHFAEIEGRVVRQDVNVGDFISWDML